MLEIKGLKTNFNTYDGIVKALDGVNLTVKDGEIFGLVGETGSGKSVTCYSALKLLPKTGEVVDGTVLLDGEDITNASEERLRQIRGGKVGIIFQDPLSALNPVMTINEQIGEVLILHQDKELKELSLEREIPVYNSKKFSFSPGIEFTIWAICISFISLFSMLGQFSFGLPFFFIIALMLLRDYLQQDLPDSALDIMVMESLSKVKLPNPKQIAKSYPHELSGGMQQRVMIAMALAGKAKMLIADEPTTALDVTIQAQILQLIKDIQKEENMSVLLITHDLGVVAETCERVAVMYKGKIVEENTVDNIFKNPQHPYTKSLLNAIPKGGKERLKVPEIEEDGAIL
jgi:peptide/nickel transport system ATP-binding protein